MPCYTIGNYVTYMYNNIFMLKANKLYKKKNCL